MVNLTMKNKILVVIIIIFMIVLLFGTYSKYNNKAIGVAEEKIGQWIIKVNNLDITKENATFNINDINWNEEGTVKEGKVAPGMNGYFDVIIDPSGTEVSIKYSITIDVSCLSQNGGGIKITSISELGGNNLIRTSENTYTGVIRLNEIQENTTNTIRAQIEWENIEENSEVDSIYGSEPEKIIELPVEVDVIQYQGETIEEYVEEEINAETE